MFFAERRPVSHSQVPFVFSFPSLVLLLLSHFSAQGDVHIKYIPLYLPSCPKWIFINCLVQQTRSILVAVLPVTQLSFAACLFLSLPEEKHVQQFSPYHLFMCRSTQTVLCVYLKASHEGNTCCNIPRDKEICGENFFLFFGSSLQEGSISWMLQLQCSKSPCSSGLEDLHSRINANL